MIVGERTTEAFETVFDPIRKARVRLTPEERVRQAFVDYLIHTLGYPPDLIAVEAAIRVGKALRRCDTVVFSPRDRAPLMVLEFKAPDVPISEKTLRQALEYNSVLGAKAVVVTNGRVMSIHKVSSGGIPVVLDALPTFDELSSEAF